MSLTALLLAAASPENAPVVGVTARDTWGLIVIGVLTTVMWLAFRRLKQLADEPEKKDERK
jgi:hypothetical protein